MIVLQGPTGITEITTEKYILFSPTGLMMTRPPPPCRVTMSISISVESSESSDSVFPFRLSLQKDKRKGNDVIAL